MKAGRLKDRLEAQSLAVYTPAFDSTPPAPVPTPSCRVLIPR
jgi:hypothetical protein